jgi:hypothetical protein
MLACRNHFFSQYLEKSAVFLSARAAACNEACVRGRLNNQQSRQIQEKAMFRTFLALIAAAAVIVPTVALAGPPRSGSTSRTTYHASTTSTPKTYQNTSNKTYNSSYKTNYGIKSSYGYSYSGTNHYHWSSCYWNSSYGCYCYWCPSSCCYYYWCEPDYCFYPTTYCPYRVYAWRGGYVVPNIPVVAAPSVGGGPAVAQTPPGMGTGQVTQPGPGQGTAGPTELAQSGSGQSLVRRP